MGDLASDGSFACFAPKSNKVATCNCDKVTDTSNMNSASLHKNQKTGENCYCRVWVLPVTNRVVDAQAFKKISIIEGYP